VFVLAAGIVVGTASRRDTRQAVVPHELFVAVTAPEPELRSAA
jgi:hypothetical protein